jgi:hypothetical protein
MENDKSSKPFSREIFGDVREATKQLENDDSQYQRRAFIRTFFSAVEAVINTLKRTCVLGPKYTFSDAEKACLKEESYTLDHKGEPSIRALFIPTKANLRFAITMFAKNKGRTAIINVGTIGWECFAATVEIRNRIVHPKDGTDLRITDTEMEQARKAAGWFFDTVEENLDLLEA